MKHWQLATGCWLLLLGAAAAQIAEPRTSDDIRDPDYSYTPPGTKVTKTDTWPEQDVELLTRPIPRPYLYLGPSLMPGGYATFAYRLEGGIDLESKRAIVHAAGAYDNGSKTNDNDQPNPKGHDRYLEGQAYYQLPRMRFVAEWLTDWFAGPGYLWSQLSTTNYTKGANRPEFGGGVDIITYGCDGCRRNFSMRATVDYFTGGNDWQNGSHGVTVGITIPTPRERRHWFYYERVTVFRFHETVTEPTNLPLTLQQQADMSWTSSEDMGIVYRF
jgi:hypothetical protein